MPRADSASAQRSVRRGWAQGRVALSRGADGLLKSNPAFFASMENSLIFAPVSLPLWNHWWGKADSLRPQPEAANAAGSSPCLTLQSHWMHRMHHTLMKGHWSHVKKKRRPLYRKLSRPTRFPEFIQKSFSVPLPKSNVYTFMNRSVIRVLLTFGCLFLPLIFPLKSTHLMSFCFCWWWSFLWLPCLLSPAKAL